MPTQYYYCCYNFFKVRTSLANANKNELINIKTCIKEKTNITYSQSTFPSCFKLVFNNSIIDLLDFIELGSWFQISIPRKYVEFFPRIVDLAGGRKSTAPFFRLYGASLSLKKCYINMGLHVTGFLWISINKNCKCRWWISKSF